MSATAPTSSPSPDLKDDLENLEIDSSDEEEESPTNAATSPTTDAKKEKEKKKQSLGLRMKKFWGTKTAGSTLGRKIIATFLGDDGNSLLHHIKAAAKKDVGETKAKQIKQIILKMAIKGKLLHDERLITKKDVWQLADPINSLGFKLYEALRPRVSPELQHQQQQAMSPAQKQPLESIDEKQPSPTASSSPTSSGPTRVDVAPLVAEFVKVRELAIQLVQPHITKENVEKLKSAFEYLGGHKFLDLLVNNPAYEDEKQACYISVRNMVAGYFKGGVNVGIGVGEGQDVDRVMSLARRFNSSLQQLCKEPECGQFSAEGINTFMGSHYCLEHHQARVQAFTSNPTLYHFLTGDGKDYYPFQADIKAGVSRHARKLWLVIHAYKTARPGLRPVFANEIYTKYIAAKSANHVPLDPKIVASIEAALPSTLKQDSSAPASTASQWDFDAKSSSSAPSSTNPSPSTSTTSSPPLGSTSLGTLPEDLFDAASTSLFNQMQTWFTKNWLNSPSQKQYMATYTLPPVYVKQLAAQREKSSSKKDEKKEK